LSTLTTDNRVWDHYYLEEADAAYLYRALAGAETDPKRKDLFERLAAVEDRHVEHWGQLIAEDGRKAPTHQPGWRARMLGWVARRFGTSAVLPLILAEEGREVAAYLRLAKKSDHPALRDTAATIAIESAEHARELAHLIGRPEEPWHTASASGYVRSIVYGFNDGLTANFGLVAGVIGASVAPHIVIITGIAGAVADALSMGASG
jgi:vacuolar iron transporter family protein